MGGLRELRKVIINFIRDERGASEIVESIFALMLILMLVFGMIHFIMVARDDVIFESAARSGAREYGITGSEADAITKAYNELRLGGARGSVYFEGDTLVVSRGVSFSVPFAGNYNFGIKKRSLFYEETESWYYDQEPGDQGSPIDGYSGYTGNPYE